MDFSLSDNAYNEMSKQNQFLNSGDIKPTVLPGGCIRIPGDKPNNQQNKFTCKACSGTGSINLNEQKILCIKCHGLGYIKLEHPVLM